MPDRKSPPFPIFLDLAGAEVLVVGSNDIAARRAEAALRAGARVKLAAAEAAPPIQHLLDEPDVSFLGRDFAPDDIAGNRLVMAATEDDELNTQVSELAQAAGIPVNVADNLRLCTFIMPAIVDRAPITAAISSGGAAPVLARRVKTRIESSIPANFGELAHFAGQVRPQVNARINDGKARRRFWQNLADGPIAGHVLEGRIAEAEALAEQAIDQLAAGQDIVHVGEIIVLGTGNGDPDLLTFRALRLMQRADVLFYGTHVPAAILDLARKDAERFSGDAEGAWSTMTGMAADGHSVLWMQSGEPSLDDSARTQAAQLAEEGIATMLVAAAPPAETLR